MPRPRLPRVALGIGIGTISFACSSDEAGTATQQGSTADSGTVTNTLTSGATASSTGGNANTTATSNATGTDTSVGGSAMGMGGLVNTTSGADTTGTGTGGVSSMGGASSTDTETSGITTGAGGTGAVPNHGDRSPDAVCARWNADRADMDEGTWSGSVNGCDPGDISANGRANALRLFNLYRWLADLPPVETSPERNQQAQACALMMDANDDLSHEPPETWTCYTELGAQGARTSNISGGPGVMSVDLYMLDTGNESTHGHRRIILANWLGPIGLGSTGSNGASCMQNIGGTGDAGKDWVAWPPAGAFPIQAYASRFSSYSETGWSIQSEAMDVRDAEVTVSAGGTELDVNVTPLSGNYGSTTAVRIVPSGWDVEAGQTYSVNVTGVESPFSYELTIVDCD